MATNYEGDGTATESPSAPPGPGVRPTFALPVDADSANAASIYQPFKTAADFEAYIMDRITRGRYFSLEEHFTGFDLDLTKFFRTLGGGSDAVSANLFDDSPNGAFGAARAVTDAGGGTAELLTIPLPIGTEDFFISMRVRLAGTLHNTCKFGLVSGATENCYFKADAGSGNWKSLLDAVAVDSGVAVDTAYQTLWIWRHSGTVTFYIDGTQVDERAFANDMQDTAFGFSLVTIGNDVGFWIDSLFLYTKMGV